jgi:hypothetical protein
MTRCAYDADTKDLYRAMCARKEEEEGEYEYASYNKDSEDGKQEAHVEPAILVQPLHEAGEGGTKEGPGEEHLGNLVPVDCPNLKDKCGKQVRHHSGSANEGGGGAGAGHAGGGPESVRNICIFNWWNPVGWTCGAVVAGKVAVEAAKK